MLPRTLIGPAENRSQSKRLSQGHKHPLDVGVLKPLAKALLLAKGREARGRRSVTFLATATLLFFF